MRELLSSVVADPVVEIQQGEQHEHKFELGFSVRPHAERCLPDFQQQAEYLERLRVKYHGPPHAVFQRIGDKVRSGEGVLFLTFLVAMMARGCY